MTKNEKAAERLQNMEKWGLDDFIFYADTLKNFFILGVEFDPEKPEVGWALFQQRFKEAKEEFKLTGEVQAFNVIDQFEHIVQIKWQSQNN